jgi:hypothetical protein
MFDFVVLIVFGEEERVKIVRLLNMQSFSIPLLLSHRCRFSSEHGISETPQYKFFP